MQRWDSAFELELQFKKQTLTLLLSLEVFFFLCAWQQPRTPNRHGLFTFVFVRTEIIRAPACLLNEFGTRPPRG